MSETRSGLSLCDKIMAETVLSWGFRWCPSVSLSSIFTAMGPLEPLQDPHPFCGRGMFGASGETDRKQHVP